MYSEQIEQLIKSVIADGVITEKERAVLHKKAASEGVDENEIDVYVDGLIAQMKSDTSKSKVHVSVNIDFNHVTKFVGSERIYYLGQKQYRVGNLINVPIQSIYLNFFKEITENQFGISIAFIYKKGIREWSNYPTLQFKSDTNIVQLRHGFSDLKFPLNLKPSNLNYDICSNYFDEEMLKLLCDAKQIKMSLFECGVTAEGDFDTNIAEEKKIDIKDISIDGLATYAQVFYRSIVDNNAYPNAIIGNAKYEDGTSANNEIAEEKSINIDDAIVARIFRTEAKKFEIIKPCPSCFKQYKVINGIIVTNIEDKLEPSEHVWPEYYLKSLTNDKGTTCFYLFVKTDYRMEELEATINMNSYQLRHISDPDSKKDEDYFFNFYEIETSLLKDMLYTKLDISLKDDEDDKEMEKIPKTWKQAFEYLTDPAKLDNWRKENPDGAGLFSKFKKLF